MILGSPETNKEHHNLARGSSPGFASLIWLNINQWANFWTDWTESNTNDFPCFYSFLPRNPCNFFFSDCRACFTESVSLLYLMSHFINNLLCSWGRESPQTKPVGYLTPGEEYLLCNACVYLSNISGTLSPSMTLQAGDPSMFLTFSSGWIDKKETNIPWFLCLISSNQRESGKDPLYFFQCSIQLKPNSQKSKVLPSFMQKRTFFTGFSGFLLLYTASYLFTFCWEE